MNNLAVKLKCGNHAIIQTCEINETKIITARIGIILPHTKCMEFLNLDDWIATYKGASQSVRIKLLKIYDRDKWVIKKNVMDIINYI